MNEAARKPRVAGFALFTLLLTAVFVALGVWQLQRRVAKHELIAALTERLAAAPVALPPPAQWAALTPARDEFRRVSFTATYAPLPDAMVYSSGSAVRKDASGPGTWAFLPARLPSGETVVIDAGFVENTMQERSVEDRAVKKLVTGAPVALTGYLRFPEAPGMADAGGEPRQAAVVRARSSGDRKRARLGDDCAVLRRPRAAGARERHSASGAARRAFERRSSAIRHHLVRACGRGADRICGLGEGTAKERSESVGSRREPGIARALLFSAYSRGWS